MKTNVGRNRVLAHLSVLLAGTLILAPVLPASAAPKAGKERISEAEEAQADLIVQYFSTNTSWLLKPRVMEQTAGREYYRPCERLEVVDTAAKRERHEFAIVVLPHYPGAGPEEAIKQEWANDLRNLGYTRLVFLRGSHKVKKLTGLPKLGDVLLGPVPLAGSPQGGGLAPGK